MEMSSNPSDAADLPISPIVTFNETDVSAAMGDEGLQFAGMGTEDEMSPKDPPAASAAPNSATCKCACKRKSHQVMCFACSMKCCSAAPTSSSAIFICRNVASIVPLSHLCLA